MSYPVINLRETGKRIKELRLHKHLSVAQLAGMLELSSVQAVYRWENGTCFPSIDNLYALSRIWGVSIDEIVRGSEEEGKCPSLCLCERYPELWKVS